MLGTTNDWFPALNKHYVTVVIVCERKDPKSEPQVCQMNQILHRTGLTIVDAVVLT